MEAIMYVCSLPFFIILIFIFSIPYFIKLKKEEDERELKKLLNSYRTELSIRMNSKEICREIRKEISIELLMN